MSIPIHFRPAGNDPNDPLLEPSFADAIGIIAVSAELPEQTRRHWATSLRQIAKALRQAPGIDSGAL